MHKKLQKRLNKHSFRTCCTKIKSACIRNLTKNIVCEAKGAPEIKCNWCICEMHLFFFKIAEHSSTQFLKLRNAAIHRCLFALRAHLPVLGPCNGSIKASSNFRGSFRKKTKSMQPVIATLLRRGFTPSTTSNKHRQLKYVCFLQNCIAHFP